MTNKASTNNSTATSVLDAEKQKEHEELQRDIRLAQEQQKSLLENIKIRDEKRRKSPGKMHMQMVAEESELDQVARRLVPESVPTVQKAPNEQMRPFDTHRGVTKTTYWGLRDKHKQTLQRGYVPVIDPATGSHAAREELLLYSRDAKITKDTMHQSARMSKHRVESINGRRAQKQLTAKELADGYEQEDDLIITESKLSS